MIFSSLVFLSVFLPVTYIVYTIVPSIKVKNAILILASLLFYAYGEPVYVLLMILSAFLNYLCALLIDKYKNNKKAILIIGIAVNLGILGVFKYASFLITSCNDFFGLDLQVPMIKLPIGISFFTFQAMSYVIDVYREKVNVQKSFWKILLYVSFFPQLIAGPIVKYRDISEEINNRKQTVWETASGLRRFICGLGKKILIANTLGMVADNIFSLNISEINIVSAWLGAIAYMMQIYYDFSGYSDMAIGLGKMFGFHFKENFNYPYGATSIQDFWRKWHISLSTWFKEYLYIPLGGNRKGKARTYINRIIVFFFTGLWHGANWTFVIWGLYHGIILLVEECVPILRKMPKVLGHIYSVILVCVGFVIFRADTISQGFSMIGRMFTGFSFTAESVSIMWQQLTPWVIVCIIAAVIGAAPIGVLANKVRNKLCCEQPSLSGKWRWIDRGLYLLAVILLAWCIIRLSGSAYNPFIYFRF